MDITHETIKTNGVSLHVAQAGDKNNPLVIMLHGFPEFWYGWRKQIEVIAAAGYWVWIPDQRGYNLSDKPKGHAAYNLDELAADVMGLIEAAGRERCVLVGHDWGGAVAWWVANKHPDKLEKLITLNIPHHRVFAKALRTSWRQKRKSWYIFFFQLPRLPEFVLGFRKHWQLEKVIRTSREGTFTGAELQQYHEAWGQPGAIKAMLNWYRAAFKAAPCPPKDPRITVPTLLMWGKKDTALGWEMAQPSIDLCDEGRLVFLDDATHWLAAEEPERVNELMVEFLSE
jgi:epoxide hydrolase 4